MWFTIHKTKEKTIYASEIFLSKPKSASLQGSVFEELVVAQMRADLPRPSKNSILGPYHKPLVISLQMSEPAHSYTQILKCKMSAIFPQDDLQSQPLVKAVWEGGQIPEKRDLLFATSPSVHR